MADKIWVGIVADGEGLCGGGAGSCQDLTWRGVVPGSLNLLPRPGELPLWQQKRQWKRGLRRDNGTRWMPWENPVYVFPPDGGDPIKAIAGMARGRDVTELIAPIHFRNEWGLSNGDELAVAYATLPTHGDRQGLTQGPDGEWKATRTTARW